MPHSIVGAPAGPIVAGLVGAFEAAFPARVRGYYLLGSAAEGSTVPLSDIDCAIVFAGDFASPAEAAAAESLAEAYAAASPVRLDTVVAAEAALDWLAPALRVALKLGSLPLHGADIRPSMALPAHDGYAMALADDARRFIARLRGEERLAARHVAYPDALDPFFGYTRKSIPAWYPPEVPAGTKELVAAVSRIAGALVVRQARGYVSGKHQAIVRYQSDIGGPWALFAGQVFERCKHDWQYLVPEGARERDELRGLCQRMLGFENAFLAECGAGDA